MNESLDQTKHDNHRRNVVNVYCDRSSRNENTSRSSTPVSMQQMITGQMTVGTMTVGTMVEETVEARLGTIILVEAVHLSLCNRWSQVK